MEISSNTHGEHSKDNIIGEQKLPVADLSASLTQNLHVEERDISFKHTKSEIDMSSSILSSEEQSDSKHIEESVYPFGENYVPLTSEIINNEKTKLGIINLFWPSILPSLDYSSRALPESYRTNSNKEKVLLLYAENFRRQYHIDFPTKKPLLLATRNECGIQKMVSTAIRPTKLSYPELYTWKGCANYVSDHIVYKPLECPHLMPEVLASGYSVLLRQSGHCFEMSTVLASYLIAVGYDAYVVSGYATKDYCLNDLTRTVCPHIPDISEKKRVTTPPREGKYTVREPRDLRSKFILMMVQREKDKEEQERLQLEEEERQRIAELEKFPHDPLYWWDIHSWVMILPGKCDIEDVLFIQPGSGEGTSPADPHYLGVESVWNNKNYWVNVQKVDNCKDLQFDLRDTSCWEHLLPGEPWEWQQVGKDVDLDERDVVLLEKHLDMPSSWVMRLHIAPYRFEQRYPLGQKITHYKKAVEENFAPYLHEDGLVSRVTTYEDYTYTNPEVVYEMFSNREDCLVRTIKYISPEKIIDEYEKGREDALMRQTRYTEESKRVMEFHYQIRYDSLKTLILTPVSMEEHFESREDRLYHRHVTFDQRSKACTKWSLSEGGLRRTVIKIVEKFHRNSEILADRDIARREFDLANEEIFINYHYEDGKITAGTRLFIKPPVADQGDRLKFDSKLTSGYVVDTAAPPQKKMELFLLLNVCLQAEQDALKHIRDMEDEVLTIFKNIAMETAEPKLKISIFDEERNSAAREKMKLREQQLKEETVREVEAETDYLAVYLVQLGERPLSQERAMELRQYCLNEYKQLLVDRANRMQHQFDKVSEDLQARHQWYENTGVTISHEEEEAYLEDVRKLAFKLHTLELRLLRHKDLAPIRYAALDNWLLNDHRLAELHT